MNQVMNILFFFTHKQNRSGGKKDKNAIIKKKKLAIHPIVIGLLPLETHSPQTLTEIQFFLLETKTYLQNYVTGTVSNKTAAANMSAKHNPYIIHKSFNIIIVIRQAENMNISNYDYPEVKTKKLPHSLLFP